MNYKNNSRIYDSIEQFGKYTWHYIVYSLNIIHAFKLQIRVCPYFANTVEKLQFENNINSYNPIDDRFVDITRSLIEKVSKFGYFKCPKLVTHCVIVSFYEMP